MAIRPCRSSDVKPSSRALPWYMPRTVLDVDFSETFSRLSNTFCTVSSLSPLMPFAAPSLTTLRISTPLSSASIFVICSLSHCSSLAFCACRSRRSLRCACISALRICDSRRLWTRSIARDTSENSRPSTSRSPSLFLLNQPKVAFGFCAVHESMSTSIPCSRALMPSLDMWPYSEATLAEYCA